MALVVQLQAVLRREAFVAVLTEMRFRFGLVWLMMVHDNLRLLRLRLALALLNNLNGSHRRVLLLTGHRCIDDGRLLRHLHVRLRLMLLLQHGRRHALNLLDDLLAVG